jgi:hypothetical protein
MVVFDVISGPEWSPTFQGTSEAAKPHLMKDIQTYFIPLLMTPKYLTGI